MLLGVAFHIGERFTRPPLIFSTLYRSFAFLVLLIVLNVTEEAIVGVVHGKTTLDSISDIAGGTWYQIVVTSFILLLVLIPISPFAHSVMLSATQYLFGCSSSRVEQASITVGPKRAQYCASHVTSPKWRPTVCDKCRLENLSHQVQPSRRGLLQFFGAATVGLHWSAPAMQRRLRTALKKLQNVVSPVVASGLSLIERNDCITSKASHIVTISNTSVRHSSAGRIPMPVSLAAQTRASRPNMPSTAAEATCSCAVWQATSPTAIR